MSRTRRTELKTTTIDGRDHFNAARLFDEINTDLPTVAIDTTRTGDAIYAPRPVGDRIVLGRAHDPRPGGASWLVTAQRLDRPWPGTEHTVTFACERLRPMPDGSTIVDHAVGAFSEADCWRYLTERKAFAVTVYDLRGRASEEIRRGLGIPEGATERSSE